MEVAVRREFEPIATPDIVRWDVSERCGFISRDDEAKGGEDTEVKNPEQMNGIYSKHENGQGTLVLTGTSEIPLAVMYAQARYNPQTLPLRTVAPGHAFRAEVGARGKDTRGLYLVHQFTKVELFSVTIGESLKGTGNHDALPAKTDKASEQELE
ncbi:unnamed protein product [Rhizoctonia solani]|uniref:serine--tRNA ligase n=1 Tax=Rhizoctonia solani TaxID=456999 RepID=A0A8H3E421_9AGAM|nr:unnamed protein product [Rhizoctonia solani]